jgi:tight adherence protein C
METFLAGLTTFFLSSPLIASQSPLVIASLVCLMLLLTAAGLSSSFRFHKAHQNLVQRITGRRNGTSGMPRGRQPTSPRWLFGMLKIAGEVNKPHSEKQLSRVRRLLLKAGYRNADAPLNFFGVKLYLAILVPAVYAVLWSLDMHDLPMTVFLILLLAMMGFYAPDIWVRMKIRRRRQKVLEGFPDALDLMVICVEAGLGLDAAIRKVSQEIRLTNRVVSEEFKLLELGLRAGQSRQFALLNLSRRIDIEEVNNFVALLIQTEQFGTGIALALRVHADGMRLKRHQIAEEKATKLPVKLLFPLLFFIFPSLFVVILGPAILRLAKVILLMSRSAPIH